MLAQRARCTACKEPSHRSQHVGTSALPTQRPITPVANISDEDAALDARIFQEQQDAILKNELEAWQSRLPAKFQHATTDHPRVREALSRWSKGSTGTAGLVILGDTGLGKTWTALGYANTAIRQRLIRPREILYGTEAELLASVANGAFGDVEPNLRRLTDRRFKMLIIDDVGRGHWLRDEMRQKLYALVMDAAWRDNKVVVITTNLDNDTLENYIGTAAMDRVSSAAGYKSTVLITGKDEHMRRTITEKSLERSPNTAAPPR